jgi:hypothetical protein
MPMMYSDEVRLPEDGHAGRLFAKVSRTGMPDVLLHRWHCANSWQGLRYRVTYGHLVTYWTAVEGAMGEFRGSAMNQEMGFTA